MVLAFYYIILHINKQFTSKNIPLVESFRHRHQDSEREFNYSPLFCVLCVLCGKKYTVA